MQNSKDYNSLPFDDEIHRVWKTPEQRAPYSAIDCGKNQGVVTDASKRSSNFNLETDTKAPLPAFIPRYSLFDISLGFRLNREATFHRSLYGFCIVGEFLLELLPSLSIVRARVISR